MKKSLVALAVLAASGAAMAQSSVTLFGRLDASIGQTSTETTGYKPVASLSQTKVMDSNKETTYWGIKGSEDLGGGLKANFVLQDGFNIDTGAATGTNFEREAHVGFAGGFGEVQVGRLYSAYHSASAAFDMADDANYSVWFPVSSLVNGRNSLRYSNAIRYDTPNFNGFTAAVSYGLGENKTATTDATNMASLNLKYAAGPLMVIYGHDEEKQAAVANVQDTKKYDTLGGTYDFGVAKLYAGYQKSTLVNSKTTAYTVAVDVPVSAAAKLQFGYAKGKNTGSSTYELNSDGFMLGGTYDLSKRTALYAVYNSTNIDAADVSGLGVNTAKGKMLAAGVRHLF